MHRRGISAKELFVSIQLSATYMTMMIQRAENDVDELLQTIFAICTDRDWPYGFPPTSN
jgi:hypothetical protein